MKKAFTSILAIILCAMIAVTGISVETAYAANKAVPFKVTFNKKSVTLSKDTEKGIEKVNVKTLTKKWGEPDQHIDGYTVYVWKKGKSEIIYGEENPDMPFLKPYIEFHIDDKNCSLLGMKVGMKKNKAAKILKKINGELNITDNSLGITISSHTRISCGIKKGKITSIFCTAYLVK